ncbi:MAG: 1-deoxy-D-xylulose-5-phosphate synthase [Oscillospiraceae bacterium]|jgi:1-deoxy-D-xylulose-5-phosphate synthase|nr:1-deoxy-D-xylulose-5-phosphate synthase [Oscillospiraceae bacterium]
MTNFNELTLPLLKTLTLKEKYALAAHLRRRIKTIVQKNGGHLASNLGAVELTIALHSVFSCPSDKIVFDVGHQAYTHKILTGRGDRFHTIRAENGLSGFPKPSESTSDAFIAGHAGIAVSAAAGLYSGMRMNGDTGSVVAVIGDGSLTNGEIHEGFNNLPKSGGFIVVLNDNGMSISHGVGAVADYLLKLREHKEYYRAKKNVKRVLAETGIGREVSQAISGTKRFVKNVFVPSNLFENYGFKYFGPCDGHDIAEMEKLFGIAKELDEPCLIHVRTKKGKGFRPAERDPEHYHGVEKRTTTPKSATCSDVFGETMLRLGEQDERVCLLTAAMAIPTGCAAFAEKYPTRFFDVGIAEGHAATFAAGLARSGQKPVFAVYSTFFQRAFDQLVHDCAIENESVVFALDRAGFIGDDGETHQGMFDLTMLASLPNTTVYSPSTRDEIAACLEQAVQNNGVTAVRYHKGELSGTNDASSETNFTYQNNENNKKLFVTYGRLFEAATPHIKRADTLKLVRVVPFDQLAVKAAAVYDEVFFAEEGACCIAEKFLLSLMQSGFKGRFFTRSVDKFVPQGEVSRQMEMFGLDGVSLGDWVDNAS